MSIFAHKLLQSPISVWILMKPSYCKYYFKAFMGHSFYVTITNSTINTYITRSSGPKCQTFSSAETIHQRTFFKILAILQLKQRHYSLAEKAGECHYVFLANHATSLRERDFAWSCSPQLPTVNQWDLKATGRGCQWQHCEYAHHWLCIYRWWIPT